MNDQQKRAEDLPATEKVISEEENVAYPVFTSFDQGGWCECSHCGATLHDIGSHCSSCGYKLEVQRGPICDVADTWGGSDY